MDSQSQSSSGLRVRLSATGHTRLTLHLCRVQDCDSALLALCQNMAARLKPSKPRDMQKLWGMHIKPDALQVKPVWFLLRHEPEATKQSWLAADVRTMTTLLPQILVGKQLMSV